MPAVMSRAHSVRPDSPGAISLRFASAGSRSEMLCKPMNTSRRASAAHALPDTDCPGSGVRSGWHACSPTAPPRGIRAWTKRPALNLVRDRVALIANLSARQTGRTRRVTLYLAPGRRENVLSCRSLLNLMLAGGGKSWWCYRLLRRRLTPDQQQASQQRLRNQKALPQLNGVMI